MMSDTDLAFLGTATAIDLDLSISNVIAVAQMTVLEAAESAYCVV